MDRALLWHQPPAAWLLGMPGEVGNQGKATWLVGGQEAPGRQSWWGAPSKGRWPLYQCLALGSPEGRGHRQDHGRSPNSAPVPSGWVKPRGRNASMEEAETKGCGQGLPGGWVVCATGTLGSQCKGEGHPDWHPWALQQAPGKCRVSAHAPHHSARLRCPAEVPDPASATLKGSGPGVPGTHVGGVDGIPGSQPCRGSAVAGIWA